MNIATISQPALVNGNFSRTRCGDAQGVVGIIFSKRSCGVNPPSKIEKT